MFYSAHRTCALFMVAFPLALLGCSNGVPSTSSEAARYLLTTEPADAQSVLDIRETLTAAAPVVLVGRIGGVEQPWSAGTAQFIVADPSLAAAEEHGDHACGDNCPFCQKKQAEKLSSLALIQFVDEQGQVLPVDARELFGLENEQTVVVRGQAHVDDVGNLVVAAEGMYIRR